MDEDDKASSLDQVPTFKDFAIRPEESQGRELDLLELGLETPASAPYPMQLRSDTEPSRVLIKHRFVS